MLRTLKTNQIYQLNRHKDKVVLIDFWSSWCVSCRKTLPCYEDLYTEFQDKGLRVIGINTDEQSRKAIAFLDFTPVNYLMLHDKNKKAVHWFNPSEIPTAYLIDREGRIAFIQEGYQDGGVEVLRNQIQILLAE